MRGRGEQESRSRRGGELDAAVAAAIEELRRGSGTEDDACVLHDYFHPRLRAFFARRVRPPQDVQDLTQVTFIKIYSNIGRYRGDARFSTWVFAIARNVLRKWRARRPPEEAAGDGAPAGSEPADAEPDPEMHTEERELRALVRQAIDLLPPRQRQCMVLRVVQGLKYQQIATVMGISVNSVKAHLNQGRTRLEELIASAAHALPRLFGDEPAASPGGAP